jgi:nucleoside-diphosphate-sugar epimerase
MLVFLAGGSGAVGRPLVSRLARAGHNVVASTRSAERAQLIRDAGAEPVVVDAFDADAFRRAIVSAKPDVVVHQMTALAKSAPDYASWLSDTNRLRAEVTAVLVDAAREAGASRVLAQSASFMTAPDGPAVLDEQAPLYLDAPGPVRDHVVANAAMEQTVTETGGIDGAALRYGFLYGPGTSYAPGQPFAEAVRTGRTPIVGEGSGRYHFVHIDDAVEATARAIEQGATGIFNVVDDEPALMREWVPYLAQLMGGPAPRTADEATAARAPGPQAVYHANRLRGASNSQARRALAWTPIYPSWREGFRVVFRPAP